MTIIDLYCQQTMEQKMEVKSKMIQTNDLPNDIVYTGKSNAVGMTFNIVNAVIQLIRAVAAFAMTTHVIGTSNR
jgi:hypothetical protein